MRYNLNFSGQDKWKSYIVAEAFEITTKLCEYETKITSTKTITIEGPILYWSLRQKPYGLKDQFSSLHFFDKDGYTSI